MEKDRLSKGRGKVKGRNEGRIMRRQTEVSDGAQLAFQELRIFCGLQCLPSWGLGSIGERGRSNQ